MPVDIPVGYMPQNVDSLPLYLVEMLPPELQLGGQPDSWSVQEVGDGNLNLVFIVSGLDKTIIVKQALPYVRAAGEGWPLSLSRAFFEYNVLVAERKYAGDDLVPEVYFYDKNMAVFAMEYLTPHVILRKELIAGKRFENLTADVGRFLARTLFCTSDIGMESCHKKALVSRFSNNHELCKITEDLIFSEPYYDAERNNWTSPQLDEDVKAVWQDTAMIQVAMRYKYKFMTESQALLHGDLHSGSIMVTEKETKVIDPEFGFMGPMAFDIGNYLGNLFFAYFAQEGHQPNIEQRDQYKKWLLTQIESTWTIFETQFLSLWLEKEIGEAYPNSIYRNSNHSIALLESSQREFMRTLFIDSLVNAGLEINRRIIGFAGVADFNEIKDSEIRSHCERKALKMARELIINAEKFENFKQINQIAANL
ncbi:MAG: S-methyl-5-thioribose kinase [Aliivibrio sp.]|uniref:S-methyl-5-thioribose kinase n=1 Tax=Aliivibrio sp. TaxID=1872443 RepID=UPI001A4481AD|nr:S-methyl-5-thioribose kinase [Aliivibrio sp.]